MNFKEGLKEVGKGLINFGVAILVFFILQPFVSGKVDTVFLVLAVIGYIISTGLGFLFISIGGNKNEWYFHSLTCSNNNSFFNCSFFV